MHRRNLLEFRAFWRRQVFWTLVPMSSDAIESWEQLPAGQSPVDNASKARRYHSRAEELRAIAADWLNDEAQAALLRVARDYDRLANSLERRSSPANSGAPRTH
jgi:hypothetical protein